jgi:plastocyanin
MKKIYSFLSATALIAAFVTACGGSDGGSYATDTTTAAETATPGATAASDSPTATAGSTITIENMAFGAPLTVAPGAEVRVANNDTVEHSVTSDAAGAFDVHVDGKEKGTLIAPTQPGEYPFHCTYHPNMKGTLIVK